jgi:aspartate/methionine/tyrosine aminotransferase
MPQVALPPGKTDVDYVLGLLRATGVLTVFGSGFGTDPAMGAFRVVFLAPPADLHAIYDRIAAYTSDFLAGR